MDLKAETLGLALAVELPLVVCDIQRAGPSTGMPTKTEQADLLMALYGRHGEAPRAGPGAERRRPTALQVAFEAVRIAIRYMTPVIVLSDGYLANGAEPWLMPDPASLPDIPVTFRTDPQGFFPYVRDEQTLSRPWVRPGTPGLEHRIGGLSKEAVTGNVSYAPLNHEQMVRLRARKIAGIARDLPPTEVFGPDDPDLLVVAWGSTFGAVRQAVLDLQAAGRRVSHVHLRHLNPLPADLGDILARARSHPGPRDQPGPAGTRAARRVPRPGDRLPEDPGPSLQGVRAGRALHAPARRWRRGPRRRQLGGTAVSSLAL